MSKVSIPSKARFQELPNISLQHLEVFQTVHREGSYSHAALELHMSRTKVKRICDNLAKELKHPLFEETPKKNLTPTQFGVSLLAQSGPLVRSFLYLGEGIRSLQRKGRILRFATSDDFFHDGAFSIILSRIEVVDSFRPCYLRLEADRFKASLLSSECDVYFGAGLESSNRLEIIHLDRIPWSFHPEQRYSAERPQVPADLLPGKWLLQPLGNPAAAKVLIRQFQKAGAKKGRIRKQGEVLRDDEILIKPEPSWMGLVAPRQQWPKYLFSAVIKKQHPYAELMGRLQKASRV